MNKKISNGLVHKIPEDLQKIITSSAAVLAIWEAITPLARNEWLCWIDDAKKLDTRSGRIARMRKDLANGKHRPCCWSGCSHR